ncbi:hypothetical protein PVAP13_3KG475100 [Panicum virgatum]|uniref:LRAT domain-containing protein n=1 Tax=Panicum virgatum TaxID=38727 RepID=A0A8T0VC09_PANVG|nr:hypothetical protein PVAP13_3KG475100 [Panicum virgatum]
MDIDRVTLWSRSIERWQLRPGDHIYAWFGFGVYSHHGIYQGDDKVIDFTVDAQSGGSGLSVSASSSSSSSAGGGVRCCSLLGSFLEGHDIRLFAYSVPWWFYKASIGNGFQDTCSMEDADPPERVLRRADYHLNHGFGNYNLLLRNCFDFAFYCKTGHLYYSLLDLI